MLLALLAAAGIVESDNPLSHPGEQALDERLGGAWLGNPDESLVYLHFVPADGSVLDLDMITYGHQDNVGGDSPAEWGRYKVVTTRIGERWFVSLKPDAGEALDANRPPRYLLAEYTEAANGALTFLYLNDKPVNNDIKAGSVAGTPGSNPTLTADPAALRAYVGALPAQRWKEYATFRRILEKIPTK